MMMKAVGRIPALCLILVLCRACPSNALTIFADQYGPGFNPTDSTPALQAALTSGADRVIVRDMGSDWIVGQIKPSSNQEIIFQSGVVVRAKSSIPADEDLFKLENVENVVLRGYGATFDMDGLGRYGVNLRGARNTQILGLTVQEAGMDGIVVQEYVGSLASRDVFIKDVVSQTNWRQGMSVISVEVLSWWGSRTYGPFEPAEALPEPTGLRGAGSFAKS